MNKQRAIPSYEGLHPLQECVQKMQTMLPLQPLEWNQDLFLACKDHCDDIGPKGLYGHSSSLGLGMIDRIRMYTDRIPGMLVENVNFGSLNPLESIILMLIDDGDPS